VDSVVAAERGPICAKAKRSRRKLQAPFRRPEAGELARRLAEPRRFIQVVAGARQVGKTTPVQQVTEEAKLPVRFASADEPTLRSADWIAQQWEAARLAAGGEGAILVIDEVQKAVGWSESVKRLWDEDTRARRPLKVVLLGSAPLLVQQGPTESLAGRFEVLHLPHWSLAEMRAAFGFSVDEYVYLGGYPGAAPLAREPALLRRLFELGCRYSGQVLSYTKMLGQLHDAGNTTTLAHYLELLGGARLLTGLAKFSGRAVRQRGSSPKLQVMNTALMTAQSGVSLDEARADLESWGRLVESAVGAHLANAAAAGQCEVFYWREGNHEVDFLVRAGPVVTAIEVKSGRARDTRSGLAALADAFKPMRQLLVGGDGIPVEEFLLTPVARWVMR
jgi:predicted AAA+ superfamily ATPase